MQRTVTESVVRGWFTGRLPDNWSPKPLEIRFDREEVQVLTHLSEPTIEDDDEDARSMAYAARIGGFREDTREQRMSVAVEAESRFGRKVSWGARCGPAEALFTTTSVPVMTRLRMSERQVLDTLIDAGVARSRSEALAWCVRLVGEHQSDWIEQLRDALAKVKDLRAEGPGGQRDEPSS
jgi:hypothetical protein